MPLSAAARSAQLPMGKTMLLQGDIHSGHKMQDQRVCIVILQNKTEEHSQPR